MGDRIEIEVGMRLCEAFSRASMTDRNTPVRNAINQWVGSLPQTYIVLLRQRKPRSLVILAFFSVLVHQSETVWFMEGNAKRFLLLIMHLIDEKYRCWTRWPCSAILPAPPIP